MKLSADEIRRVAVALEPRAWTTGVDPACGDPFDSRPTEAWIDDPEQYSEAPDPTIG